jgi:valyl-tRNA synthetase
MEQYDYQKAIYKLHDFFWHEFCDHYLEYVKHRIYGKDENAKTGALFTLTIVLENSLLLLAPIAPHISEEIYHEVLGKKNIHHAAWPAALHNVEGDVNEVAVLREAVVQIRQHKAAARLPQNAELGKVVLTAKSFGSEMQDELKKICNVKELEIKNGEFHVSVI